MATKGYGRKGLSRMLEGVNQRNGVIAAVLTIVVTLGACGQPAAPTAATRGGFSTHDTLVFSSLAEMSATADVAVVANVIQVAPSRARSSLL
jgi:hypothetical protein